MRPQKQKNRHNPAEGLIGDCHRTCVAMILDLDREEVPNWAEAAGDDGALFRRLSEDWLRAYGYATVHIPFTDTWKSVGNYMLRVNPGVYYILGGESRSGVNHSVVAVNDIIAFDPSLSDAGIVAPCNDGYYWVTVFVPIAFTVAGNHTHDPNYVGLTETADG